VPISSIVTGSRVIHNIQIIEICIVLSDFCLSLHSASNMLKQDRTIIHVEVKETHEHFYFGSAAAMYEDSRVKNLLGIAYQTFRTKKVTSDNPFENEYVIVRKGELNTILHGKNADEIL
jgi:hypothetical protein